MVVGSGTVQLYLEIVYHSVVFSFFVLTTSSIDLEALHWCLDNTNLDYKKDGAR